MNTTQGWAIVGLIVLLIALVWLFWPETAETPVAVKGPVAQAPAASKPGSAPAPARAEAPLSAVVHFEYNQSTVRPGEASKLDELAARLKSGSFERLDAVGHADRIGSAGYNLALSERRATAVRDYLSGKGVDAQRIRIEAKGKEEAVTGTACRDMGPENRGNRKLIECLQRDRRVAIAAR